MWTHLRSWQFSKKTLPWVFTLVAIAAYGLLAPWMGFYWDDWVFVWLLKHNGPVELARSFLPYDPLVSPFFLITSSLFGTNAFAWQIFGLIVRVAVSLAALWTFNQIWPQQARKVLWAALFFLLYPGYAQQWVAFTHANQEWISFGFFILSLGFTAKALHEPGKKWLVFALITQCIGLVTTEYFLGMELLRPFLIWIVLLPQRQPLSKQLVNTGKHWLMGYILIWLIAGIGQFLYHRSGAYGGHSFGMDLSERGIPQLVVSLLKNIVPTLSVAGFEAWTQTFKLLTHPLDSITDWLTLFLILLSFIGLAFYLYRLHLDESVEPAARDSWAVQAIVVGLVGILAGRLPSWLAGMPVVLRFDWDRLLISMMFGASLLIAGLIDFLVKDGRRKEMVISLILALAIGMQFQQANTFRRDWQNQKNFFTQLAWRAPSLKPGTMLLTEELPLDYVADLQLSAPLNLLYAPDASSFSYILLYRSNRQGGTLLPRLAAGLPAKGNYRTVSFESNTSNIVMLYMPSDGCLQLFDPRFMTADSIPGAPQVLTRSMDLSNIDQVQSGSAPNSNLRAYFGEEPEPTWCYYFEKAELARQFNDWDAVLENYRAAVAGGYSALQPSENLVFIEALARSAEPQKAIQLTNASLSQDRKVCKALVAVWQRALDASPEIQDAAAKQLESLNDLPECR